jgi:hypothetical protein
MLKVLGPLITVKVVSSYGSIVPPPMETAYPPLVYVATGSLYRTPVDSVVEGTFSKTVMRRSFKIVIPGSYRLRNRSDKKGRYLESIWLGFPGEVCTDLIV